jgi:hypothetical protein
MNVPSMSNVRKHPAPRVRPSPEANLLAGSPFSFSLILDAMLVVFVALAAWQLAMRVPFRWDMYIWSESPFLTNMLKLTAGQPVYTSPDEANSFIYSPGLEYLTYALLRPFGVQLDIRYCRAVSVALAVLASMALGRCARVLAESLFPGDRVRRVAPTTTAFAFLVIYRNFTSDVPHPDNLHIFHASVTLALVFEAVRRGSTGLGAAAVAFASLGVLAKQVAVPSAFGVWAALAVALVSGRRLVVAAPLLALAAVSTALSVALLWSSHWGRFYTYDTPSAHGVELAKVQLLATQVLFESRVLLLTLALAAVAWCTCSARRPAARLTIAYLLVGAAEFGLCLLAHLKPMGAWNNLAGMEAWAVVPVVPLLLACLRGVGPFVALGSGVRPAALVFGLVLAAGFVPRKLPPTLAHAEHCRTLQRFVARDLKGGKRVLVAHGATFLIRNGRRDVPLDRANSLLELNVAGNHDFAATRGRIVDKYYDTIYLNSDWYPAEIRAAIERNYREVARVPGTIDQGKFWYVNGYQGLTIDTRVLERKS